MEETVLISQPLTKCRQGSSVTQVRLSGYWNSILGLSKAVHNLVALGRSGWPWRNIKKTKPRSAGLLKWPDFPWD